MAVGNGLNGKSILVVDDEVDLREILVEDFEDLGCRVFQADNGRHAVQINKAEQIDLIVSDVRMPNGDGIELLEAVRMRHRTRPPVVLLTGYADLNMETAFNMGAEAMFPKPFDRNEILSTIERLLRPREERWSAPSQFAPTASTHECSAGLGANLKLGQGGFFLADPVGRGLTGDIVTFDATFKLPERNVRVRGKGQVRWVRPQTTGGHGAGRGIEILSVESPDLEGLMAAISKLESPAYIPIA